MADVYNDEYGFKHHDRSQVTCTTCGETGRCTEWTQARRMAHYAEHQEIRELPKQEPKRRAVRKRKTKRCRTCGKIKPVTEFGRHPQTRDGLKPQCGPCNREEQRRSYGSSTTNRIKCLECGEQVHTVAPHLRIHNLTTREYRERHPDAPLTSGYNASLFVELHGEARWTREAIIKAIQRWAKAHGGEPPTNNQWKRGVKQHPNRMQVYRVFGSWNAAIEAAGFAPRRRGKVLKDKCKHGHSLTDPANVYLYRGARKCRTCGKAQRKETRKRKRKREAARRRAAAA